MGHTGFGGLAAVALIAAGCATTAFYGLEPGRSTEADVRRALGEPAMALPAADGSRQLVYPQGQMGTQTWMAYVLPDGRLSRLEQALTDDNLRRVSAGIARDDVLRLIGPPWRTIDFPNMRQVAWDYRIQDTWGYHAEFSVMIDERGVVAATVTARFDQEHGEGK